MGRDGMPIADARRMSPIAVHEIQDGAHSAVQLPRTPRRADREHLLRRARVPRGPHGRDDHRDSRCASQHPATYRVPALLSTVSFAVGAFNTHIEMVDDDDG